MFGLIKVKCFQFQNIWSQWTTSQKKLFFVLEYVQIAPSSHKIEVDLVNAGMSQTLSYFQSSVTPPQWSWDFQTSPGAKWTALDGWVVKRKLKERGSLLMQLCVLVFLDPYLFLPLVLYLFVHIPDPTKYIWSDSTSDVRSVWLTYHYLSLNCWNQCEKKEPLSTDSQKEIA